MRTINPIVWAFLLALTLGSFAPSPVQSAEPCTYIENDALVECERVVTHRTSIATLRQRLEEKGLELPSASELAKLKTGGGPVEYENARQSVSLIPLRHRYTGTRVVWNGTAFEVEPYSYVQSAKNDWEQVAYTALLVLYVLALALWSGSRVGVRSPLLLRPAAGGTIVGVLAGLYLAHSWWLAIIVGGILSASASFAVGRMNERRLDGRANDADSAELAGLFACMFWFGVMGLLHIHGTPASMQQGIAFAAIAIVIEIVFAWLLKRREKARAYEKIS